MGPARVSLHPNPQGHRAHLCPVPSSMTPRCRRSHHGLHLRRGPTSQARSVQLLLWLAELPLDTPWATAHLIMNTLQATAQRMFVLLHPTLLTLIIPPRLPRLPRPRTTCTARLLILLIPLPTTAATSHPTLQPPPTVRKARLPQSHLGQPNQRSTRLAVSPDCTLLALQDWRLMA